MFTNTFVKAVVALAAANLVSAQTFTDCNPLDKTCPAEAAFGKDSGICDFKSECKIFTSLPGTSVSYESDGARFRISKEGEGPTFATQKRIFFGRVDVELKSAPGIGIVTSVVLESADLDEVDWEWLGADDYHVQSNYFGKGDTTTYDRVALHNVATPSKTFHTYTIEATSKFIAWSIDGTEVRRLLPDQAKGGSRFPQTPFEVKIGTWVAGGKDSPEGTVEWAGGRTDFSKGPFDAYYKSISIIDYAGGDAPTKDSIKEYVYGDKTGSWESIKIVKGDGADDDKLKTSATITKTQEIQTRTSIEFSTSTLSSDSSKTSGSSSGSSSASSSGASSGTTATPSASGSQGSGSGSTTGSQASQTSGSSSAPSTTPNAAAQGVVSFAGLAIAAAVGITFQLL
uniref:Crh-like protein n=1 Tax=Bionectria ochroleuca TaxID=29856 RepID=A0A0B7K6L4_BIOOC